MAQSSELIDSAGPPAAGAKRRASALGSKGWSRWFWPSLFDLIVVSLPIWFFAAGDGGVKLLLSDGDTGWHIRTGDWILTHRQFVHSDLFSFSKPGQPWFAWEWLSDVIFSLLHSAMGMKGLVIFGIIMGTLYCGLLFRQMVWRGANVFIALPLALMGFGAATVHLLARPHLWTMALVALSFWLVLRDLDRPTRWIWSLVPLAAVWTNLHGGWLALIAILGLVAVGTGLEALFGEAPWATVKRYCALAGACFAASLLNPYGYRLHVHMYEYLTMDWIKELVSEFKSPTFRSENMAQFELLLVASLLAAGMLLMKKRFVGPLLILFWAHSALVSARHIPIFIIVALPFLAGELSGMWDAWVARGAKNSIPAIFGAMASEAQAGISRASVWMVIPFLIILLPLPIPWPSDLSDHRFPAKMVSRYRELIAHSRIFTQDQWADYLIYHSYPDQKVFFDGRTDFYGEKITRDYCDILNLHYAWRERMEKYGFDAALVEAKSGLATHLKELPDWRLVADDGKAILFQREGPAGAPAKNGPVGANENASDSRMMSRR